MNLSDKIGLPAMVLAWAALMLHACSSTPERDDVLQAAIQAGHLACQTALNDPKTEWAPGAREYCVRMTQGCPAP